jgi:hypothetical protein
VRLHEMRIQPVIACGSLETIQHARDTRPCLFSRHPLAFAGDNDGYDPETRASYRHCVVRRIVVPLHAISRKSAHRMGAVPKVVEALALDVVEQVLVGELLAALAFLVMRAWFGEIFHYLPVYSAEDFSPAGSIWPSGLGSPSDSKAGPSGSLTRETL